MQTTEYIWINGKFTRWGDAKIHILSHCIHYGSGAFEGIRVYETPKGPAIFRLDDHVDRLLHSCSVIDLKPNYTKIEICSAIKQVVKKNGLKSGYIRPIIYYGYGKMGLNPSGAPTDVAIAAWPWGKYLGKDAVRATISKFTRLHPKSFISTAKLTGYYINSIFASIDAHKRGYDEAILLDARGYIAEGPGENVFGVKKGILYTPKSVAILPGITRDTMRKIAKQNAINYVEVNIKPASLKAMDEVFFCGTAAEVTGISHIDKKIIGNGRMGPVTSSFKKEYEKIVTGKNLMFDNLLTYIK